MFDVIIWIIQCNVTNKRLDNLSIEIKATSDTVKEFVAKTRDIEESLNVNQALVDDKIKMLESQLTDIKKQVADKEKEMKEKVRILEDRSRRNNIRVDGIS